jgi:uncharacterized membrane protein YeaQ/YmgE (transglycosylase-associated protein family)
MTTLVIILSWIIFGGIVGLVARAILPGRQSMGAFGTILLGIAGSFVGGMLGSFFFAGRGGHLFTLHAAGWIGSTIGAIVLLALVTVASRRGVLAR